MFKFVTCLRILLFSNKRTIAHFADEGVEVGPQNEGSFFWTLKPQSEILLKGIINYFFSSIMKLEKKNMLLKVEKYTLAGLWDFKTLSKHCV